MATIGRDFEPISQATFVEGLLAHISRDPKGDRDRLLRGERLDKLDAEQINKLVFRNLFIESKDVDILAIIHNYFLAASRRWPVAWNERGRGAVLNRTNGIRALLRFLRYAYLKVAIPGDPVSADKFYELVFRSIELEDSQLVIENFVPGTAGEAKLLRVIRGQESL
jgi:hypothetical protein